MANQHGYVGGSYPPVSSRCSSCGIRLFLFFFLSFFFCLLLLLPRGKHASFCNCHVRARVVSQFACSMEMILCRYHLFVETICRKEGRGGEDLANVRCFVLQRTSSCFLFFIIFFPSLSLPISSLTSYTIALELCDF